MMQFMVRQAMAIAVAVAPASRMVAIPSGSYMPLYADAGQVSVAAFRIDVFPVTRAQYLEFLRSSPAWRLSAVKQPAYLRDWAGELDAGPPSGLERPVVWVTRPAARAYCAAQGKRLPTTDEWEYVAAASGTSRKGTNDPAFRQEILDLYTRRRDPWAHVGSTFRNIYGVADMHGLVWEWTEPAHNHSHHAPGHHDMSCAGSASGASTTSDFSAFMRYAFRSGLSEQSSHAGLGFRCATGG
jgi:formylglycine-generating enzyme required for sulfatase activity